MNQASEEHGWIPFTVFITIPYYTLFLWKRLVCLGRGRGNGGNGWHIGVNKEGDTNECLCLPYSYPNTWSIFLPKRKRKGEQGNISRSTAWILVVLPPLSPHQRFSRSIYPLETVTHPATTNVSIRENVRIHNHTAIVSKNQPNPHLYPIDVHPFVGLFGSTCCWGRRSQRTTWFIHREGNHWRVPHSQGSGNDHNQETERAEFHNLPRIFIRQERMDGY